MKKLFFLVPLVFLAFGVISCDNSQTSSSSSTSSEATSNKGTSSTTTSSHSEEAEIKLAVSAPNDNSQFYFGFYRSETIHLDATQDKPAKDILKGHYYITGKMDGYYFETTMELTKAVKIITIKNNDAWHLKVAPDQNCQGAGKYIGAEVSGYYLNIKFLDNAFDWKFSASKMTFIGELDGKTIAMGTQKEKAYTTLSVYNAGKNGYDGNYLANLLINQGEEIVPDTSLPDPAIDNNSQDDATSEDTSKAVAVYDLSHMDYQWNDNLSQSENYANMYFNGDITSEFTNSVTGENKVDLKCVEVLSNKGCGRANSEHGPKVPGLKMQTKDESDDKYNGEIKFALLEGKTINKVSLHVRAWTGKKGAEDFTLAINGENINVTPNASKVVLVELEANSLTNFTVKSILGRVVITKIALY